MNRSDSERIAAVLESAGYRKSGRGQTSTVLVLNACSVRQSAIDRVYGQADAVQKLPPSSGLPPSLKLRRTSWRARKTIVTGCVLPKDRKAFSEKFDLVFHIKDLKKLPHFLNQLNKGKDIIAGGLPGDLTKNKDISYFSTEPIRESRFSASVPISFGCSRFCTYCAVPYARGLEINRPKAEVIREVKDLIYSGYREIWLLGQTVSSWRDPGNKNYQFVDLLQEIEKMPGHFWVRFTSPYVLDFNDKLIGFLARAQKINNYFNLPLQSGDNAVLRRMNRHYTVNQYLKVLNKIKERVPEFSFSTDIIIGFCKETEKQFNNTFKVFAKIKPAMAYIALYSPRPGTVAAKVFKDDVPMPVKKTRYEKLTKLLRKTAKENLRKEVGRTLNVLVDTWLPKKKECLGKTRNFKTVRFESDKNLCGRFVKVRIVKAREFELEGRLT